jgi:hypothetical protein
MAKRRVVVEEAPTQRRQKMPDVDRSDLGPVKRPTRRKFQTIPTGDPRHMGAIREGRLSFEVFAKSQREKIPVDADVDSFVPPDEIDKAVKKADKTKAKSRKKASK